MSDQVIGKIPEFENDSAGQAELEKEFAATQVSPDSGEQSTSHVEEKETPSETTPEEQPAAEQETAQSDDTGDLKAQLIEEIEGLKEARKELISEVKDLRGQRREAKEREIAQLDAKVEEKVDDLNDLNPDDVKLIDRILTAKGYVPQEKIQQMFYESRKQDAISKFFTEYPEYKEENDPDGRKFGPLKRELALYKEPQNPDDWSKILRRAHETVTGTKVSSGRSTQVLKRQAELAGVGAGTAQRSPSVESHGRFTPEKRAQFVLGGWSEEEIDRMEERLSE